MRILLYFLLLNSPLLAQPFRADSAYLSSIDLPQQEPFDTAHRLNKVAGPYVYIMSDNDVYKLFGYNTAVKYFNVDFTQRHIIGKKHCMYSDINGNCNHRNACDSIWVWAWRSNEKAFTEVAVKVSPGHIGTNIDKRLLIQDTVIKASLDTGLSNWYTDGAGDCHAHFKFKLYTDKYHPVLLQKEWNYYGGCRAGGRWDFTLSFRMPTAIRHFHKNVILVDKDIDGRY